MKFKVQATQTDRLSHVKLLELVCKLRLRLSEVKKMQETMLFGHAQTFAEDLSSLTFEYPDSEFIQYGKSLQDAIEIYDTHEMKKVIQDFQILIYNLDRKAS